LNIYLFKLNDTTDENNNNKLCELNQYIKVFGKVESLNGHNYILAFNMSPIKELNEVTNHILEAMNASIHQMTKMETVESMHSN
jgi:hypothetical protein